MPEKNENKSVIVKIMGSIKKFYLSSSLWVRLTKWIFITIVSFFLGVFSYHCWEHENKQIFNIAFLVFILISGLYLSQIVYTIVSEIFNWLYKKNNGRRVDKQFTNVLFFLESVSFGKTSVLLRYFCSNKLLNRAIYKEIKDIRNKFENENNNKRQKTDNWEYINYHNNFQLFCELIEVFSHQELDELENLEAYLMIEPKKNWFFQFFRIIIKPIIFSVVFPTLVNLFKSSISQKDSLENDNLISFVSRINLWEIFNNPNSLPVLVYGVVMLLIVIFLILLSFKITKNNDHIRSYLSQVLRRAKEEKFKRENTKD